MEVMRAEQSCLHERVSWNTHGESVLEFEYTMLQALVVLSFKCRNRLLCCLCFILCDFNFYWTTFDYKVVDANVA
jgi:hypothetical protein